MEKGSKEQLGAGKELCQCRKNCWISNEIKGGSTENTRGMKVRTINWGSDALKERNLSDDTQAGCLRYAHQVHKEDSHMPQQTPSVS